MSEHTITTEPIKGAEGILLNVYCACGQFIGTFDDTAAGRALATAAKNAHRLAVGAPPVLPDGSDEGAPTPARVEFDVEYEVDGRWVVDRPAFLVLEHARRYRNDRMKERAHGAAPMRVSRVTTTTVREPVA